jgi:hypothetical protein
MPLSGKTLVLINEQNVSGPMVLWHKKVMVKNADLGVVENELIAKLMSRGLRFVDPDMVTKTLSVHQGLRVTNLTVDQVKRLGHLTGADFVLFGKAVAVRSSGTPVENLYSAQATLSLRLVRVKDGEIVSATNVLGSGLHAEFVSAGTMALTKAAQQATERLERTLIAGLRAQAATVATPSPEKTTSPASSGKTVRVQLHNVASYKTVGAIMKALRSAVGEKNIRFVSLSGKVLIIEASGIASFEIAAVLEKLGRPTSIKISKTTADAIEGELR